MKQYKVTATKVTQSANEILGTNEKTLWYLIIEGKESKVVLNVGEKTYKSVRELKPVTDTETVIPGTDLSKEIQEEIKKEIESTQIKKK